MSHMTPAGRPDDDGAIRFALSRLRNRLPVELTYHSLWHTTGEVMPAARRLAEVCGVPDEAQRLLTVAAAFHDIGYVEGSAGHEERAAEVVGQVLPGYGFEPAQVARVQGMILATRVPQRPADLLEEILCDADLDGLGREDFFDRSAALRQEQEALGHQVSDHEWNQSQLEFLKQHRYFTPAARAMRDPVKALNQALLVARCRTPDDDE